MKSWQRSFVGIFFLIFSMVGQAKTHTIKMLNKKERQVMIYDPGFLKINKNDQVIFNAIDVGHLSNFILLPKNAKLVKQIKVDQAISFEEEGIYLYECENHSILGMVGMIQVGKPTNIKEVKTFVGSYHKNLVSGKDRLPKYIQQIVED